MSDAALGITRSILGQPWHWRRASADMAAENLAPDDLVTQLLLARGVTRDGHVLVEGPDLRCRSFGADDYLRVVAACRLPDGRELGCEQVRARVALRWARYGGAKVCR